MSQGTAKRVGPRPLVVASRQRRLISGDRLFRAIAYGAAALIIVVAVIFVIALFIPALPAIMKFGLGFFVSRTWDPVRAQFGALPAIYGTLVTSAIALVIAFPIGMGAALFLALGATNAETIWSVVLPYARVGITGAVLLSLGRALGETIAVTMVIGNRPEISSSLFSTGYTLPSVIANEFTEAVGNVYLGSLFYLGLVLVLITVVVNVLARLLTWRFTGSEPTAA